MKKCLLLTLLIFSSLTFLAQEATEVVQPNNSAASKEVPAWKKKLYYGYNFDIYFHHDSKTDKKENGFSFSIVPELGWRLKERVYIGMRFGGSYENTILTTSYVLGGNTYTEDLRVRSGAWEITPYVRYRMKTFFNDKFALWLETHVYTGMDFPSVASGKVAGTDYDGLRYEINYGVQVSPVITYQFSEKKTFQLFFSIVSLGYSGTTRCYTSATEGNYKEYSNDVIMFSGKLRNLLANQFAPGLYGIKFGVIKNF